jgi:uncharacterized membrane protein
VVVSTLPLAFLIGVIAGLRSLTAPAVVSWAARLGWLHLDRTPLAFMALPLTSYIFTALAIVELISDKLPKTPSRKAPPGFIARVLTGALCGATFGAVSDALAAGLFLGVFGAVAGTLSGYEFRKRLVRDIGGRDLPIALLEDAIAIGGAIALASRPF